MNVALLRGLPEVNPLVRLHFRILVIVSTMLFFRGALICAFTVQAVFSLRGEFDLRDEIMATGQANVCAWYVRMSI